MVNMVFIIIVVIIVLDFILERYLDYLNSKELKHELAS